MAERTQLARAGRMPPTLRGILLARIGALPEAAQSVIGVAAVAGRRVDHDLLAAVAEHGRGDDLIDALREAVGQPGPRRRQSPGRPMGTPSAMP